jgi:ERCC4-related helicase
LQLNAENIRLDGSWQGNKERQIIASAEQDFAALWNNQHPAFRVVAMPEAVREKLVRFSEHVKMPVELDAKPVAALPPQMPFIEQLRFQFIRHAPKMPGGEYVGMYTAPIEPWPHQHVVARRLIDSYPSSFLLCDEVGLGKTIEAGLAFRSLYLSGRAQRILIAAPASLTQQWQREMASKFLLPFARVYSDAGGLQSDTLLSETQQPIPHLYAADLSIVSTGLMVRKERLADLKQAPAFDIALVDEAHYARRSNSRNGVRAYPQYNNLYKTISDDLRSKSQCLLLATATPMQLHPVEVTDLIALSQRVGAYQYDPSLMLQYYQLTAALAADQRLTAQEQDLLRHSVNAIERADPILWRYLNEVVISPMVRLSIDSWRNQGLEPSPLDKPALPKWLFAAAPLSRVMLRHTRDLLKIYRGNGKLSAGLAERHVLAPPRIVFTEQESRVDQLLQTYCEGLREQLGSNSKQATQQVAVGFYLSFLRLRFASSLLALKLTLQRRLDRVKKTLLQQLRENADSLEMEDIQDLLLEGSEMDEEAIELLLRNRTPNDLRWEREQLEQLLSVVDDLSPISSKTQTLFTLLQKQQLAGDRFRQVVIFTRFYDTLTDIVQRVRTVNSRILIGTYSGQGGSYYDPNCQRMVNIEREKIKRMFVEGNIDLLVCTDAAAEGLNLQTADMLVNYDLPWNPMKVEQRIGRIDRIGQCHEDIYVVNLCYADSAEQFVYERLMQRLQDAGLVVGTQQFSLLPVTVEEFQELAEKRLSEKELEKRALERAKEQKAHHQLLETPAQHLYETYLRFEDKYASHSVPITLAQIWEALVSSTWLQQLGCQLSECQHYLILKGIESIPDDTRLTIDRDLFDKESSHLGLNFASYGDPVFEQLLRYLCALETQTVTPALIKGERGHVVQYALVANAIQPDGSIQAHLITRYQQIDSFNWSTVTPADDVLQQLQQGLQRQAEDEANKYNSIKQLDQVNTAQGLAQQVINNFVLKKLLEDRLKYSKSKDIATDLLREIATLLDRRKQQEVNFRASDMPITLKPQTQHSTLIQPHWPANGNGWLDTPLPIAYAALDAGYRLVEKTKQAKSQLTGTALIQRLERNPTEMF